MNALDALLLFVLLLSLGIGLIRGLMRELISLGAWGLALLLAWWFYKDFQPFLALWVPAGTARRIAAFSTIVLLSLGVGTLLGYGIRRLLVEKSGLHGTDRLLGGLFGTVRALLLLAMVAFLGALTPWSKALGWQDSLLMGRLQVIAEQLFARVPVRWAERIRPKG